VVSATRSDLRSYSIASRTWCRSVIATYDLRAMDFDMVGGLRCGRIRRHGQGTTGCAGELRNAPYALCEQSDEHRHGNRHSGQLTLRYIYIAGPYIGDGTHETIARNIYEAEQFQIGLVNRGIGHFCPHNHSRHFEQKANAAGDYWYEVTLHFLGSCDALLAMPRWRESRGARGEIQAANERGLPVFYPKSLYDDEAWREIEVWARGGE
jgi:hypothetical protein